MNTLALALARPDAPARPSPSTSPIVGTGLVLDDLERNLAKLPGP